MKCCAFGVYGNEGDKGSAKGEWWGRKCIEWCPKHTPPHPTPSLSPSLPPQCSLPNKNPLRLFKEKFHVVIYIIQYLLKFCPLNITIV